MAQFNVKKQTEAIWNMPKDNVFKMRVEQILRNALWKGFELHDDLSGQDSPSEFEEEVRNMICSMDVLP
jgi:hypothetical protein